MEKEKDWLLRKYEEANKENADIIADLFRRLEEITMYAVTEELISMSRAKELLGCTLMDIREKLKEII